MSKSKTKTIKKKTIKSSKQEKAPVIVKVKNPELDELSEQAITLLKSLSMMEFLQYAAPAIRDLGIYNIEGWSGGFPSLYREIFNVIFDKERKLQKVFYPIVKELRDHSTCGSDRKTLAATISRVGATYAFVSISMDRNLVKQ